MTLWQKVMLAALAVALPMQPAFSVPRDWPGTVPDQPLIGEFEQQLTGHRSSAAAGLDAQAGLPDLEAVWIGTPRWMGGVNWGGRTFFGSLDFGTDFFGSSLLEEDFVPVTIEFSADSVTLCQVFRRDLGYASVGVGQFPGMAWDMSNPGSPRRLNICLVEDNSLGVANFTWDPNATTTGKREYVFVMDSDYDGTGLTYAGQNISSGASSMDIQYGWWPRVEPGQTFFGSLPASIDINPYYVRNLRALPTSGSLTLTWAYSQPADWFRIYAGTSLPPTLIDSVGGATLSFQHMGLVDGITYYYRVEAVDNLGTVAGESIVLSAVPQVVSSNMTLLGAWHERGTYGDCWGYVDTTTGTEYALICARNEGVSIVDIDQDPPVEVGFMPGIVPGNDTKDVKLYKHYAIIIAENESAQVFDIANPAAPVHVSTIPMPFGEGAHNCLVEGDYLYVIGDHNTGGLLIYDISNPTLPDSVGSFTPFYYHDIDIRNDTVCATGIYGDGIDLVDVSNKTSPSLITRFNYAGSGAHNAEYSADGQYVFIGDEIGSSGNWTRVFDISNPGSVSLVAEMIVDPLAAVHNCYLLHDTLLVIGHYTEGVRIWNVVDPVNPFEIAHYDTYLPDGYGYSGVWSVYPYFPSGRIIASDMQTGLYVLEHDVVVTPGCCVGLTGNVNGDPGDEVTLTDLTVLVNHLFVSFDPLTCPEEANTSGDPQGDLTLTDLTALVNSLFVTFDPLPACQ